MKRFLAIFVIATACLSMTISTSQAEDNLSDCLESDNNSIAGPKYQRFINKCSVPIFAMGVFKDAGQTKCRMLDLGPGKADIHRVGDGITGIGDIKIWLDKPANRKAAFRYCDERRREG